MAVNNNIPQRASRLYKPDIASQSVMYGRNTTEDYTIRHSSRGWVIISGSMAVTLCVILIWIRLVIPWWQGIQDQWNDGDSRITQFAEHG